MRSAPALARRSLNKNDALDVVLNLYTNLQAALMFRFLYKIAFIDVNDTVTGIS